MNPLKDPLAKGLGWVVALGTAANQFLGWVNGDPRSLDDLVQVVLTLLAAWGLVRRRQATE